MKVLVTGAEGQLGRCMQDVLLDTDHMYIGTNRSELDICDPIAVKKSVLNLRPEVIVNTAAYTAVDQAESEADKVFQVNQSGPENLAVVCAELNIPLIHISTDYVFDGRAENPYSETAVTNPQSVYGRSKLAGEQAVARHAKDYLIIRTAWVFSEYGNNFLKTMLRLGKERDALNIVSDQIGCPTYAGDLAKAIVRIIDQKDTLNFISGIYHYCGAPACSWFEFATEIFKQSNELAYLQKEMNLSPIPGKAYPTPAARPGFSVLDCSKIQKEFGVEPANWKKSIAVVLKKLHKSETDNV